MALAGDDAEHHDGLRELGLGDNLNLGLVTGYPPVVLGVMLLILAKVFFIGKEPKHVRLQGLLELVEQLPGLGPTVLLGLLGEDLAFAPSVRGVTEILIDCPVDSSGFDAQLLSELGE